MAFPQWLWGLEGITQMLANFAGACKWFFKSGVLGRGGSTALIQRGWPYPTFAPPNRLRGTASTAWFGAR